MNDHDPLQWSGRKILHPDHALALDMKAARYEFGDRLPREEAEHKAYGDYTRERHVEAAAHHLVGMRAARTSGDFEASRKHGALYHTHLEALGLQPVGPVPPEVHEQAKKISGVYKFKPHTADAFALARQPESSDNG